MTRAAMGAVLSLVVLLQGCENLDGVRLASNFTGGVSRLTEPQIVTDYAFASAGDLRVITRALALLKPSAIGQNDAINGLSETEVRFSRGSQTWTSRVAQYVRLALPSDAVKARHLDANKAIEAFARYAALRPDTAVTHLYVAAPVLADRNWMAAQARKAGFAGLIDELDQPYTAIGWTAPGLVRARSMVDQREVS